MSDLELHNAPDRNTELVEPGDAFARLERRRLAATLTGHYDVIVIGGGQAGLVTGYHLQRAGLRFLILDAGERIGDPWRRRWDSLRLFTPSRYDALSGMTLSGPSVVFPDQGPNGELPRGLRREIRTAGAAAVASRAAVQARRRVRAARRWLHAARRPGRRRHVELSTSARARIRARAEAWHRPAALVRLSEPGTTW